MKVFMYKRTDSYWALHYEVQTRPWCIQMRPVIKRLKCG